eukprot:274981_1
MTCNGDVKRGTLRATGTQPLLLRIFMNAFSTNQISNLNRHLQWITITGHQNEGNFAYQWFLDLEQNNLKNDIYIQVSIDNYLMTFTGLYTPNLLNPAEFDDMSEGYKYIEMITNKIGETQLREPIIVNGCINDIYLIYHYNEIHADRYTGANQAVNGLGFRYITFNI